MRQNGKKIVIVGGGIAGLCTAVYALKCGYQVEVLEMHDMAGGLAMSWRRGRYTFETCLHWLVGSSPGGEHHAQWQEIFDIDRQTFINPVEFVRLDRRAAKASRSSPTSIALRLNSCDARHRMLSRSAIRFATW